MEKLVLFDGSALLTTNYFATIPEQMKRAKEEDKPLFWSQIMQTSTGIYTNAVVSTLKQLLKIIHYCDVTHAAVMFDESRDTFRREIYPEYKGNRKKTEKPLSSQFGLMIEVLNRLGIKVVEGNPYEADDYIGSYAKHFSDEIPVKIMTKDHDLLQCVGNNVNIWLMYNNQETVDALCDTYNTDPKKMHIPFKTFEFDEALILPEFGVLPEQIPDLKGIAGDTSDNIPGVKGVSENGAIPLLMEFGTLENLYNELRNTSAAGFKELCNNIGLSRSPYNALVNGEKNAFLSKKLATIKADIEINDNLSDLAVNINTSELHNIAKELESKTLASELPWLFH